MKNFLQLILRPFGFKILTLKEYDRLISIQPKDPERPKTLLTYKEVVHMLRKYDDTRIEYHINTLGFEDTRVNTFDFFEMKNYLTYVEKLAKEKGIRLKGISFIKGVYSEEIARNDDFIGYENLLYLPTAIVNGEEILIDVINSSANNISSFKDQLKRYDYEWRYDNAKNFKVISKFSQEKQIIKSLLVEDENGNEIEISGAANMGTYTPPYTVN